MKFLKSQKYVMLTVLMMSLLFIPVVLFAGEGDTSPEGAGVVACSGVDCDVESFFTTIQNVIKLLLQIGIAFVAVIFTVAGYTYLTAGGDSGKVQQAHNMFKNAAIGFIVMLTAFLLVELLTSTLGLKSSIIQLQK